MLDDDDLPVLNAVVRGGDEAVIRAAKLGFALGVANDAAAPVTAPGARLRAVADPIEPARATSRRSVTSRARPVRTPQGPGRQRAIRSDANRSGAPVDLVASTGTDAAFSRGAPPFTTSLMFDARSSGTALETDDVARIDLGHAPIGIDASRDVDGNRASRLLADVRVACGGFVRAACANAELAMVDAAPIADAEDELDDTLALDDADIPHVPPSPHLRRGAVARARRSARSAVPDADTVERLVDDIVERHVRALKRDVRDALERTLGRDRG